MSVNVFIISLCHKRPIYIFRVSAIITKQANYVRLAAAKLQYKLRLRETEGERETLKKVEYLSLRVVALANLGGVTTVILWSNKDRTKIKG